MIIIKNKDWEIIKTIEADLSKTLLRQLQDSEVEMAYACHTGICGACMCQIESGSENVNKSFKWEPWFPLWDDEVMTCIAWVINKDQEIILKTIY